MTTATPAGWRASDIAMAICLVRRSWTEDADGAVLERDRGQHYHLRAMGVNDLNNNRKTFLEALGVLMCSCLTLKPPAVNLYNPMEATSRQN